MQIYIILHDVVIYLEYTFELKLKVKAERMCKDITIIKLC